MSLDSLADVMCQSGDIDLGIQLYEEILRRLQVIEFTGRKIKSEVVIYYKMSQAQRKQLDLVGEKTSLEKALKSIQRIDACERNDVKELEARISMALQS
jgi:hypothetical protein